MSVFTEVEREKGLELISGPLTDYAGNGYGYEYIDVDGKRYGNIIASDKLRDLMREASHVELLFDKSDKHRIMVAGSFDGKVEVTHAEHDVGTAIFQFFLLGFILSGMGALVFILSLGAPSILYPIGVAGILLGCFYALYRMTLRRPILVSSLRKQFGKKIH